jgi:hypothetical protein
MIPSLFVRLEALPLLPNGKVDRQALPAPNREEDDAARVFVAARSPLEETLAQTWAAVLGLERAGVHDNFFDLGGDSILAIQIAVKASRSGLRLTPKDIFEHQTVAELAAFAATASTVEPEREAAGGQARSGSAPGGWRTARDIPIAKLDERELHRLIVKIGGLEAARRPLSVEDIEDVYAFSPAQRVMLLYSLSYPADCGVYHQQFCYRLRGDLDAALFERSWQRVVERHPVLRTAFRAEPLQVVKRHAAPPFDYRDWRELSQIEQEEELEEFLKTDRRRRFELSEPPLMRLALFRLSQDRYWFVWSSHHVIMDGWSASIVLREFLACYDALRRSEVPDLPPAPPFRDYIAWLQQQDRNEADAEGFWRELLKDFAAPTPLGLDAALRRSQAGKASYGERQMQLSAAETASLQDFARKHRVTLNTVTQTAWALVLSRYSGESDVVFGAVLSARPSTIPGVESMVGPLINTLPIRARLSANDSVRTLLKERHRQQVEMSPYAYSSMLKVHDWSGVPRGIALFDSLFLFQSYPEPPVQGRDAALEVSLDRSVQRTNCPLNVAVWPGALLCISVNFAATRFEAATIARMLEDFKAVLQAMVADPQKPVGNLMDMGTGIFSRAAATPEQ